MASEWTTVRAADFIEFNPRLSIKKGAMATKVAMDKLQPFTKKIPATEQAEFAGGSKFCNGDTIMARITPCLENGKTAYVDILADGEVAFGSTEFIVMRARAGISDPQFVYYLAISPAFRNVAIKSMVGSSGRQRVQQGVLDELELIVPPLEEQQKIGAMLAMLDQKIALNNKINDNLQQQAQAVFSAWLATHASIADEVTLGGVCLKVTDGSHFSPKDEPSAKIPMLSVKDMEKFDFNLSSCKHISAEDYQKMVANDCVPQVDDILVAKDGSYLKEIFICNKPRELAILSSIAILRPDTSKIYPEILLAFLKSPRVLQEVRDNYVSGSALPRIVLKDFKKLQFLLPNLEAQGEIAPLLESIRSQIAVNVAENQQLSQLRDALLPKLMSGAVDVSIIDI